MTALPRLRVVELALLALLLLGGGMLIWQLFHATRMMATIRAELLHNGVEQTRRQLDGFFKPVELSLALNRDRGAAGLYQGIEEERFNLTFLPVLDRNRSVSSLLMADAQGNEHMLLWLGGGHVLSRTTTRDASGQLRSVSTEWKQEGNNLVPVGERGVKEGYQPVERPWFKGALETPEDSIHWTEPYTFYTTRELGVTAAYRWHDQARQPHVIAYDVLLSDLSEFLYHARPSPNGKAFLMSRQDLLLGMTEDARVKNGDTPYDAVMAELELPEVTKVRETWKTLERSEDGFSVDLEGQRWAAIMVPYRLGEQVLNIGVMIPEQDVLGKVRFSSFMLVLGGVILLLLAAVLYGINRMNRSTQRVLQSQNEILSRRTRDLDHSFNYAKYLQDATLPPSALIKSWFSESFVVHQPKEVVGGDLYWMEPLKQRVLFAVADCTGHGVPGALVSMACTNALDRAVRELGFTDPTDILETARQFVMEAFQRSQNGMNDGMDIALCSLSYFPPGTDALQPDGAVAELHFAGGNRPVWVLRKASGAMEVLRTDRQPVRQHGRSMPFSRHRTRLMLGDVVYLFTDGFVDQFGGTQGRKFGNNAFRELLLAVQDKPMEEQGKAIAQAVLDWQGDQEQVDDRCMMGVRINALDRMVFSA